MESRSLERKRFTYVFGWNFNIATVENSMFGNGARKCDKTEHKEEDHKIQHHKEPQEREI